MSDSRKDVLLKALEAEIGTGSADPSALFTDDVVGWSPYASVEGLDAMMALALALDLDPIFVGAHHLARFIGVSLALPLVISSLRRRMPRSDESPRSLRRHGSSGDSMRED